MNATLVDVINGTSKTIHNDLGIVVGSGEVEGTDNAEKIYGDIFADVITPKKGNDTIYGISGNDTIYIYER